MGCLAEKVGLGDIRDVDAMVSVAVRRTGLILSRWEREELECEALLILCELRGDWDGRGSFAGYAGSLLGLRLLSAWHRLAGHSSRRVFDSDGVWTGKRAWCGPPVVSLDVLLAQHGPDRCDGERLGNGFDERR